MSALLAPASEDLILDAARRAARADGLAWAGSVSPVEAWSLVESGRAVLVDVRSSEERRFVGHVPASLHVPWATGTALVRNPGFLRELESKVDRADVVLLLCRSGKRSVLAAEAAARIGFHCALVVREGFEGELDASGQRGHLGGWRMHGLKWVQD